MDPHELLPFLDTAFDGMLAIAEDLGDDLVNVQPDLPGANSAFAVVTHCVGVADWWLGHQVAGRTVERDRDAEFTATGTVEELAEAVAGAKERIRDDLATIRPDEPLRDPGRYPSDDPARTWNQAAALVHTLEELAQHHGHMELTRDLVEANRPV